VKADLGLFFSGFCILLSFASDLDLGIVVSKLGPLPFLWRVGSHIHASFVLRGPGTKRPLHPACD